VKNLFVLLFIAISLVSCENTAPTPTNKVNYPSDLIQVFDKHGGLSKWKSKNLLSYEIHKDEKVETQVIDLITRREKIEASNFKTGYDGTNYWVEADSTYKGNPIFYHNLMFYFYAMPFVLADEGINYKAVKDFEFDGKINKGISITYNSGVGVSSGDEYILYYDSETYQMTWLAYTVTYFDSEKETEKEPTYGWIRYDDWKNIDDLVLPHSLSWYKTEDNKPSEFRSKRYFEKIRLSEKVIEDSIFEITENAITVEE
jgi:hypothetical protein